MYLSACPHEITEILRSTPTNHLLSALPEQQYQEIAPHLECVSLPLGEIIFDPGEAIDYIYFPDKAMISLISEMKNGATTEISLIGKNGLIGLPRILGAKVSIHQAIVQVMGTAMRIKAETIEDKFNKLPTLRHILLLYTQTRLSYIGQLAACNRQHKIEKRLARWLLLVQDCLADEELPLTQEFIANMLGTNRAGVTIAAGRLQKAGIISYTRGSITVLDRPRLEQMSCECYGIMRQEQQRLFGDRFDLV